MKSLPYILIAFLAFSLGWCSRSPTKEVYKYDTIQSEPIVETEVKIDTQYILSPFPYLAWIDHTDTIYMGDSCWHLREYKEYRDSNYYAKVSGIAPRLDEFRVYPKTLYETQYIYRDVVHKPKRWGVGVSAGYGVGRNGFTPVLAFTVNYNLWQF
jgi:hypothetical protein